MKLADYLSVNGLADSAFAARIGVKRQALHRYKTGERRPEWDVLARIMKETGGAVTPNDFLVEPGKRDAAGIEDHAVAP